MILKYRPEIDGLRALAVVPVILFHAGFELFSGGFVGVDVFFVISGYLITTILIEEIENNRFNLINFYERRARRILPALFFMMLICFPFAWMWMLPSEMRDFSRSIVAVSLFSSNFLFWQESGYFAAAGATKPLLHTWSLAIEEQYYVLFPIFLLLAWRFGKNKVFWMTVVFAAISLALSEWGWRNQPTANFYLAPTRIWELLAGSIATFIVQKRGVQSNNFLSLIGLAAIVFSIFAYDENTPFPSIYASVPVTGVVLLILFGNKNTLVGKLLSTRYLVGIGLISYSAYLWHHPLFAFAKIRLYEPSHFIFFILTVFSLIIAYLSWRFIEQPFRRPSNFFSSRNYIFTLSSLFLIGFVFVGYVGHLKNGFSDTSDARRYLSELESRIETNHGLHTDCEGEFNLSVNCRTDVQPNVLLWGDSYAMHLYQGIQASNPSVKLQQHTLSNCSPILDISNISITKSIDQASMCITFNNKVFDWLDKAENVEFVVLSSKFQWLGSEEFVDQNGNIFSSSVEEVLPHLVESIERMKALGKGVILVAPSPSSRKNIINCLINNAIYSENKDCVFSLDLDNDVQLLLEQLSESHSVYWLYKDICDDDQCAVSQNDFFIYRDTDHLSKEGSAFLGYKFNWFDNFRQQALLTSN